MDYSVKDVEYESKYRTDVKSTVVKARANHGVLLKGFEVCLAAHVQPHVSTMTPIVKSAGGNGIGHFIYLEMTKRLQNVGVHSIFCWVDEESEGFWIKQGFVSVGEVDTKGKARNLPIKSDIRKSLCFPRGSTLMISHLQKDSVNNSKVSLQVSSLLSSKVSSKVNIGSNSTSGLPISCLYEYRKQC